jgi:hypothetical protein
MTNTGAKTVYITQVGGHLAGGRAFLFSARDTTLPKRLDPGEYFHVLGDPRVLTDDVQFLAAWDSLDNVWRASQQGLKRVRKEAAALIRGDAGAPGTPAE